MHKLAAALAVSLLLGLTGTAAAQDRAPRQAECRRNPGPPPFIECGDDTVYGRPHRPGVSFIIPRARDVYRAPPLRRRTDGEVRSTRRRAR